MSKYSSIKFDLWKNMRLMLYEYKKILYSVMNKRVNVEKNTKEGKNHFYLSLLSDTKILSEYKILIYLNLKCSS